MDEKIAKMDVSGSEIEGEEEMQNTLCTSMHERGKEGEGADKKEGMGMGMGRPKILFPKPFGKAFTENASRKPLKRFAKILR